MYATADLCFTAVGGTLTKTVSYIYSFRMRATIQSCLESSFGQEKVRLKKITARTHNERSKLLLKFNHCILRLNN